MTCEDIHRVVNDLHVTDIRHEGETTVVYLRLPSYAAQPIAGGCNYDYCRNHLNEIPKWDVVAVCVKGGERSWTVHMPTWNYRDNIAASEAREQRLK